MAAAGKAIRRTMPLGIPLCPLCGNPCSYDNNRHCYVEYCSKQCAKRATGIVPMARLMMPPVNPIPRCYCGNPTTFNAPSQTYYTCCSKVCDAKRPVCPCGKKCKFDYSKGQFYERCSKNCKPVVHRVTNVMLVTPDVFGAARAFGEQSNFFGGQQSNPFGGRQSNPAGAVADSPRLPHRLSGMQRANHNSPPQGNKTRNSSKQKHKLSDSDDSSDDDGMFPFNK